MTRRRACRAACMRGLVWLPCGASVRGRGVAGVFFAALLGVAGCGGSGTTEPSGSAPARTQGNLAAGVVARVGSTFVTADAVAKIAAAQNVDLVHARDLAIRDALWVNEARALGMDSLPSSQIATSAVLARRVLAELQSAVEAQGPVTDEELGEVTARHWLDLDRPAGYRTVHVVVRLDDKTPDEVRRRARALADSMRSAVEPIGAQALSEPAPPRGQASLPDPLVERFQQAVGSVPAEGFTVVAEPLPPMAADGRGLDGTNGTFDEKFSRAAADLKQRGELSPVIESSFGLHVIMLLERTAPHVLPAEERRRLVRDEVMTDRARAARDKLLERLRGDLSIERNADSLLALVPIER